MKYIATMTVKFTTARGFGVLLMLASALTALAQTDSNSPDLATADGGLFSSWFARVTQIQSEQPHWITPLTTVTPRLEQELRYDQSWETTSEGARQTTYGGKGLEVIPAQNVEVILGIPAYETRTKPDGTDGFADETFLFKYRIASANEDNGNYIVTGFLGLQTPTGHKGDTGDHYIVTPTLALGKGWGDFDIQGTLGVPVPDDGAAAKGPGTPLLINTALQYRVIKVIWPELEVNYTYWPNGEDTGRNQVFLTPGLLLGRFQIYNRVGFTIGLGYQVALTAKPAYNHNLILSARIPF